MGAIVEFRGLQSSVRRSSEPVPAQGAQILFFLGVRYERHEAPAGKPPRKRASLTAAKKKSPRRRA